MSSSNEQYWLARWVDEYEVANADEAARLLKLPGPMARLPELAAESPTYLGVSRKIPDLSVTAGRGIDLSGYLSCSAFKCMRDMVNESYAKILHYLIT